MYMSFKLLPILLIIGIFSGCSAREYDDKLSDCSDLSNTNRAKDFCITSIAVENKDATICDNEFLSASGYSYECRAQVFANLDRCLELSPPALQASCFIYMSEQQNNVEACDRIEEIGLEGWEEFRDNCYLNYYGIINMTGIPKKVSNDRTICEKLLSRRGINSCYFEMADIYGEEQFCDRVVAESEGEKKSLDSCYYQIAMSKGNEELCGKITDYAYTQQRCYYFLAKEKSDALICVKILSKEEVTQKLINDCLKSGSPQSTCSQISGDSLRESCYYSLDEAASS